ncbi:MAG TPA: hypothetical protein VFT45_23685, partial [Longimicrobium sp.]|nr:hypothetical protein [Longimicrobium sp.]
MPDQNPPIPHMGSPLLPAGGETGNVNLGDKTGTTKAERPQLQYTLSVTETPLFRERLAND